jgi:phage baseplate assembly protein W
MAKYSDIGRSGNIVSDDEAILNAFIAFLATRKRSRWFNPSVGINWDILQFKTLTGGRLQLFKIQLIEAIKRNEPRVIAADIDVVGVPDDNEVIVTYRLTTIFGTSISYSERL